MNYDKQLLNAARNWKNFNPQSKDSLNKIAGEIATNNSLIKHDKPCKEFDYSGTIWCDNCAYELSAHLSK